MRSIGISLRWWRGPQKKIIHDQLIWVSSSPQISLGLSLCTILHWQCEELWQHLWHLGHMVGMVVYWTRCWTFLHGGRWWGYGNPKQECQLLMVGRVYCLHTGGTRKLSPRAFTWKQPGWVRRYALLVEHPGVQIPSCCTQGLEKTHCTEQPCLASTTLWLTGAIPTLGSECLVFTPQWWHMTGSMCWICRWFQMLRHLQQDCTYFVWYIVCNIYHMGQHLCFHH